MLRFQPIAERLAAREHRVFVALRDLTQAHRLFQNPTVQFLQAPVKLRSSPDRFDFPSTLPHILSNMAFGNVDELCALARAWRTLFDWTNPDVIVFDHSPTALLAARSCSAKRALIGAGFCCPAACQRFPDWRPWQNNDPQQLQRDEEGVLENANRVLKTFSWPTLARLSDLYREVDETLLTTFAELDPFRNREPAHYWGVWAPDVGESPVWPAGAGPRCFAYLRASPSLPAVLDTLAALRLPAAIYCPDVHPRLRERFSGSSLRFSSQPIDVRQAARDCDVAILNATLNTTATMLLAGKPVLLFPLQLEQRLTAERVAAIGAGRFLLPHQAADLRTTVQEVLGAARYAEAAREFARKYAEFAPERQIERATQRLLQLSAAHASPARL